MPEDFTGLSAREMELIENLRLKKDDHFAIARDCAALDDDLNAAYHRGVADALVQFIDILENRGR